MLLARPDLVKPYPPPPPISPDDLPPDYMALLSLIFGLVGLLGKVRVLLRGGRRDSSARRARLRLTRCLRADEAGLVAGAVRVHFLPGKRQKEQCGLQADDVQRHVSGRASRVLAARLPGVLAGCGSRGARGTARMRLAFRCILRGEMHHPTPSTLRASCWERPLHARQSDVLTRRKPSADEGGGMDENGWL